MSCLCLQDTLTTSVQKSGAALMSDTVPAAWDTLWEGPESPLDYCRAVVNKAVAIEAWNAKCMVGSTDWVQDGLRATCRV